MTSGVSGMSSLSLNISNDGSDDSAAVSKRSSMYFGTESEAETENTEGYNADLDSLYGYEFIIQI